MSPSIGVADAASKPCWRSAVRSREGDLLSLKFGGPSGLSVGTHKILWCPAWKKEGNDAGHRIVRDAAGFGAGMAGR